MMFIVTFENDGADLEFLTKFFGEDAEVTLDGIIFMIDEEVIDDLMETGLEVYD